MTCQEVPIKEVEGTGIISSSTARVVDTVLAIITHVVDKLIVIHFS